MANVIATAVNGGLTPHKALMGAYKVAQSEANHGYIHRAENYLRVALEDFYAYCYSHDVKYMPAIVVPIEKYYLALPH